MSAHFQGFDKTHLVSMAYMEIFAPAVAMSVTMVFTKLLERLGAIDFGDQILTAIHPAATVAVSSRSEVCRHIH